LNNFSCIPCLHI